MPALALTLASCQSTTQSSAEQAGKNSQQVAPTKAVEKPSAAPIANSPAAADREDFIIDYDSNKDGKASKAEFDKSRAEHLLAMDSNRNGAIEEQEYVDEYATRVEKQFSEERKGQVSQTLIRFTSLDRNKDKKVTAEEFQKSGAVLFEFLDKKKAKVINRNTAEPDTEGRVSRSLLDMPSTHSVAGFLEIYDQDGNGEVTLAEFEADRKAKFAATDGNRDGWLSSEEYLLEFENRLDSQIRQVRSGRIKQAHVRFAALDTDKNANLSLQEFTTSGDRIFKGWDTNQDGLVSDDEALPEPKQRQDKGQDKKSGDDKAKAATAN